jgi:hypothetical protein
MSIRMHPIKRVQAWVRRRHLAREDAEQQWLDAPLKDQVPHEALAVAEQAVNRELASLEALNNRLLATIAFAGALLTLAVSQGQEAGRVFAHHATRRVFFEVGFVAAVALLVAAVLVSILALRPTPRHLTNPALLKHYGIEGAACVAHQGRRHATTPRHRAYRRDRRDHH